MEDDVLLYMHVTTRVSYTVPNVTRAEATAIPVHPFGAYGLPPVGKRTINDRTAARFPLHGSNAIGLGRDRCINLSKNNNVVNTHRNIYTMHNLEK